MSQGLVTIMLGDHVAVKVVVGSNGENAQSFGRSLSQRWPMSIEEVYTFALSSCFGTEKDLVVANQENIYHNGRLIEDEEKESYTTTFDRPGFYPRDEKGVAEYLAIFSV